MLAVKTENSIWKWTREILFLLITWGKRVTPLSVKGRNKWVSLYFSFLNINQICGWNKEAFIHKAKTALGLLVKLLNTQQTLVKAELSLLSAIHVRSQNCIASKCRGVACLVYIQLLFLPSSEGPYLYSVPVFLYRTFMLPLSYSAMNWKLI